MRNSVVLPAPFGPMTPTMPPGGSLKVRSSISRLSPIALGEPVEVDDVLAEPLGHRDDDLRRGRALLARLRQQLLIALIARLGLGLPRLGRGRDPLLLARERLLARLLLAAFLLEPLLLLHQPGRIVALVGNALAAIELEDPAGDVVEEVAVVGDDQDRARIVAQMAFEPGHRLGVEMVGRLVEQQQLGLRRAAACTARRGGARRPTAWSPRRRRAGSAARPSPGRPWSRDPTGPWPRSRPAASSSRRRSRPNSSWRARCSGRGSPSGRATPSMTFSRTVLVGSSCGSCGR